MPRRKPYRPTREEISGVRPWDILRGVTSGDFPGDSHERLVYAALWRHTGYDGACWPSLPTLALETGLCRRVVGPAVERLRQRGLLTVENRPGRVNRYYMDPDELLALFQDQGEPVQEMHGSEVPADASTTPPVQEMPPPVHEMPYPVHGMHGTSACDAPEVVTRSESIGDSKEESAERAPSQGSKHHDKDKDKTPPRGKSFKSVGDLVDEIFAAAADLPEGHRKAARKIAENFRKDESATSAHHQLDLLAKAAGVPRDRFPDLGLLCQAVHLPKLAAQSRLMNGKVP
jgi:hypothetical protein